MDPEKKSLNFIFPTKYVIPKSLKFSHWLSEEYQFGMSAFNLPIFMTLPTVGSPITWPDPPHGILQDRSLQLDGISGDVFFYKWGGWKPGTKIGIVKNRYNNILPFALLFFLICVYKIYIDAYKRWLAGFLEEIKSTAGISNATVLLVVNNHVWQVSCNKK